MPSFLMLSAGDFVSADPARVISDLVDGYAQRGYTDLKTDQVKAWQRDIQHLQGSLREVASQKQNARSWTVIFEFVIPRKEVRIDCVILTECEIVPLEMKSGVASREAATQVEHYALLLHYFHQPSRDRHIFPIAVAPSATGEDPLRRDQLAMELDVLPTYWIHPTRRVSWEELGKVLLAIPSVTISDPISPIAWNDGAYYPVPTIIDAARDLRDGLRIHDIAHSEASEHEISAVTDVIRQIVDRTEREQKHSICFLTGVPGSGKTLVGLSLAHLGESRDDAIHFMSGNGPLVKVLQENFRRQAMRQGVRAAKAKLDATVLIENVHKFAKAYSEDDQQRPPSNHVVIFDEAQRAWNKRQNKLKFNRDYSEPEMLLSIMARHRDWSVVIALVGGGQEINSGEAGLEEWGKAISESTTDWQVFASPEVIEGGASTAGRRLFAEEVNARHVRQEPKLHLRTSNRSVRAEDLAGWVNAVIAGDAISAASFRIADKFPLFLTRDLGQARSLLRQHALGESRYGLIGSSGAARLRAEGLEPNGSFHAEYPWEHWYLASPTDIRSSFQCEVFATEFEVQGLELDWTGVCWDGDFVWTRKGWSERKLFLGNTSKWSAIKSEDRRMFRRNAYRVLLTRGRQGTVIFVPRGDLDDPTRNPEDFDHTADFLLRCGVRLAPADHGADVAQHPIQHPHPHMLYTQ